ncbi:diguanylate cyclase [Thiotrichales bacterium 19S3-7]|nr:diguanylate cyclase [Thiotrichales bacterium 19S3-7]MCF6803124.1 diguanylate cyclase [Thiotrichales bacterium 19S3-11]
MALFKKIDLILLCLILSLIFWVLESLIDISFSLSEYIVSGTHYFKAFIYPEGHELYMRIIVISILLTFGIFVQLLINKQRFIALHDPVTNAPNYKYVISELKKYFSYKQRSSYYIAVIKINRLSLIQRTLSNDLLNIFVSNVVKRLMGHMEHYFIGACWFSHFVFVINDKTSQAALDILSLKLNKAFEENFIIGKIPFHVDWNMGFVSMSDAHSAKESIQLACHALKDSYASGNNIATYQQGTEKEELLRIKRVGEIYKGIQHNEFKVYLQPKVELSSGSPH